MPSYMVTNPISTISYQSSEAKPYRNGSAEKNGREYFTPAFRNGKAGPTPTRDPVELEIDSPEDDRGQWGSKAEFILSCVGLSVGIGNVWRFPYLAYQYGGGAFLLPYFILLLFVGKPMYFMEVSLGQFTSLGPVSVWRCFPLAKGVGVGMAIISLIVSMYYNVIMAYTLFYMGQSFRSELPWKSCQAWWNADENCYSRTNNQVSCNDVNATLFRKYSNITSKEDNFSLPLTFDNKTSWVPIYDYNGMFENCTAANETATEQFWKKYVLGQSEGIDYPGKIKWDLAVCLLVSWVIVFLCLMKGVKSSGKVVYFTATFPYVILIILFIFGLTLEGSGSGVYYFFVPDWPKLLDIQVWRKAAEQLFFSLSVSWGGLIMFGSYNKFSNKVHRDALFVSSLDFLTSIIAGVVIFSVLGNMSHTTGIPIDKVTQGGQGLAFVAYPEALSRLWVPQLWSVLFFFMLFLLGLDSEFGLLETFLTAIYDEFPSSRKFKVAITFFTCLICFLIGLSCVTEGGSYVLNLMDTFAGGFGVLFIAICELIGLMWGYGFRRFCRDIQFMLGFEPGPYWKLCWAVISPIVLVVIFVIGLVYHEPLSKQKEYTAWSDGVGWFLALISMIQIPIWAFIMLIRHRNDPKKVLKPTSDWGPGDRQAFLEYKQTLSSEWDMSQNKGIDNPAADMATAVF